MRIKESKVNSETFTAKFCGMSAFQELWLVDRFSDYNVSQRDCEKQNSF